MRVYIARPISFATKKMGQKKRNDQPERGSRGRYKIASASSRLVTYVRLISDSVFLTAAIPSSYQTARLSQKTLLSTLRASK